MYKFLVDYKTASVSVMWKRKTENGYKCFWPFYEINKKLRNCVPPPLEVDMEGFRKWKLLDCVPLSKKKYNSYEAADEVISLASEFDNGVSKVGKSTRMHALPVESVGSATVRAIQVNLEDENGEEKMIELLKINKDDHVETLQGSLKNGINFCALIAVYTKMYADNPKDLMEKKFCRTFEYQIRIKIVFRPYKNRIDVTGTPLLNCWMESLRTRYGMYDEEAMSIITSTSLKIRNAKAQKKCRLIKKQHST